MAKQDMLLLYHGKVPLNKDTNMAEQHTEHETDDVFILGHMDMRYRGVDIGFIPEHLIPRLTFEVTMRTSGFTFYYQVSSLTMIGAYLDGKFIGGIHLERTFYTTCRTWCNDPMERWNAHKLSAKDIESVFKDNNQKCHPTFYTLSEMLLYHLSKGSIACVMN